MAHNGEILLNRYEPDKNKKPNEVLDEVEKVFNIKGYSKKIRTMTLEASVVRLSDIIAYIGRDIEDAITVGTIKREDIPREITEILGNTNAQIVNTLTMNVIENSLEKSYLQFSENIFEALIKLKEWNYKNIYASKDATQNLDILENAFSELYYIYLDKVEAQKEIDKNVDASEKNLYSFINTKSEEYRKNTDTRRMIIDYISGQTDKFFLKECKKYIKNFKI